MFFSSLKQGKKTEIEDNFFTSSPGAIDHREEILHCGAAAGGRLLFLFLLYDTVYYVLITPL